MEKITELMATLITKIVDNSLTAFICLIFLVFMVLTSKQWQNLVKNLGDNILEWFKGFKVLSKSQVEQLELKAEVTPKRDIMELYNHRCIYKLQALKNHKHEFYTEGELDRPKTIAFEIFLRTKMESTIDHIRQIVTKATHDMNKTQLRGLVQECFGNCNTNVEQKMINTFIKKQVNEKESFELVSKFLEVREVAMESYSEVFDEVFGEDFEDNYSMLQMVFLLIHIESQGMVQACIDAFEHINGAFLNSKYAEEVL